MMPSTSDIARTVAAHAQQLETLQGDVHAIRKTQGEQGSILAEIRTALRTQEATRPPGIKEQIGLIRDVAVLIGIGAASIAYVLNATAGADAALLKERDRVVMSRIEQLDREDRQELQDYRRASKMALGHRMMALESRLRALEGVR